jgi:hypothetical protein
MFFQSLYGFQVHCWPMQPAVFVVSWLVWLVCYWWGWLGNKAVKLFHVGHVGNQALPQYRASVYPRGLRQRLQSLGYVALYRYAVKQFSHCLTLYLSYNYIHFQKNSLMANSRHLQLRRNYQYQACTFPFLRQTGL